MALYAGPVIQERVLQRGDQVFYIVPTVEFDKRTKKWEKIGIAHRGAGLVLKPMSAPGALLRVLCVTTFVEIAIGEEDLEYVPPFDEATHDGEQLIQIVLQKRNRREKRRSAAHSGRRRSR